MTSQYYNTISLFEHLLGFEDAEEKLFLWLQSRLVCTIIEKRKLRIVLVVYKAFSTNSWSFVSLCHLAT